MDDKRLEVLKPILPLLGPLVTLCLTRSIARINELGQRGMEKVTADILHLGKADDTVLLADGESELVMLHELDVFGEVYHVKFLVYGEEIGWRVCGDMSSRICLLAFMDGIDGTAVYADPKSAFDSGPMLSIFTCDNPTFGDAYAAGSALVKTGWMVVADRAIGGAKWTKLYEAGCPTTLLRNFEKRHIDHVLHRDLVLADDYALEAKQALQEAKISFTRTGSTAATIVLLALLGYIRASSLPEMNKDWMALLLDQFDKRELEQPVLYLIMHILGGSMLRPNGTNFRTDQVLSIGSNHAPDPEVVMFTLAPTRTIFNECQHLLRIEMPESK